MKLSIILAAMLMVLSSTFAATSKATEVVFALTNITIAARGIDFDTTDCTRKQLILLNHFHATYVSLSSCFDETSSQQRAALFDYGLKNINSPLPMFSITCLGDCEGLIAIGTHGLGICMEFDMLDAKLAFDIWYYAENEGRLKQRVQRFKDTTKMTETLDEEEQDVVLREVFGRV